MKKWRKALLAGLITVLPIMAWAAVAYAQDFRSGGDITVGPNQVVDKSLFAAGRTIDIAGKVNGDVFCAGQSVTITGTVDGDVLCAGQSVHIAGSVTGSVRVVGQDVLIGAMIDHNLTTAGQNMTLESNAFVNGDATIGGQNATLNGRVGRDVATAANSVDINGKVGRDVQATNAALALGSNAVIGGNLQYTSSQSLSRANGAQVVGTITHKQPKVGHKHYFGALARGDLWFALYLFVSLLLMSFVLVLLVPQLFHEATQATLKRPGRTFLTGFVASIVAPVVIGLLMVSVVGLPLGVLALLIWLVMLLLSGPFAAYYLGRLLMIKSADALLIMLLGTAVLLILYFLPFLGMVVWLVAMWFGIGIIVMQVRRLPKSRYKLVAAKSSSLLQKR